MNTISFDIKKLFNHSAIYVVGNLVSQIIGFLMLPIYTRYLSPSDYGIIGLMILAVNFIEICFGARLYWAIPKFYYENKDRDNKTEIISTAIIFTSFFSILSLFIIFIFNKQITLFIFNNEDYSFFVLCFSVLLLTQAYDQYLFIYLRIQQRPFFYVLVSLFKLFFQLSLNIYFVVLKELGIYGIAYSSITSSSILSIFMLFFIFKDIRFIFNIKYAILMCKFCFPLWISGVVALYIGSSCKYFLKIFSTFDDIGLYELAFKFSTIISTLVWNSFATFWQIERFNIYNSCESNDSFRNVFDIISGVLVIFATGISMFAGPAIRLMASEIFFQSSKAVIFLCYGSVLSSLVIYLNFSFLVESKNRYIIYNNIFASLFLTVFYFYFIPRFGFVGASIATMLAYLAQFLFAYFNSLKIYNMNLNFVSFVSIIFVSFFISYFFNNYITYSDLISEIFIKFLVLIVFSSFIFIGTMRRMGFKFSNFFVKKL